MTSRNPNFDAVAATMQVDPLPDPDAVAFLLARTGSDPAGAGAGVRAEAAQLAVALGGLPLALEQAAAHHRWRSPAAGRQHPTAGPGP